MARNKRQGREAKRREAEARRKADLRNRIIRGALVAVAVVVVAVLVVVSLGGGGSALAGDTTALAWDLPELGNEDAGRIALSDFGGKPTIAVFFVSWCTECEWEIPEFVRLHAQLGDEVNWVGINSQDNGRGMGDARKWGIDERWPLGRDIGGTAGSGLSVNTFGARGMPMTVVYDTTGQVSRVFPGAVPAVNLLRYLEETFGITG